MGPRSLVKLEIGLCAIPNIFHSLIIHCSDFEYLASSETSYNWDMDFGIPCDQDYTMG